MQEWFDNNDILMYSTHNVGKFNNTYHYSIGRIPVNADCSILTEKIENNSKAPTFKVNDRVGITK